MIEAFANHLSSHLGRHIIYWALGQDESEGRARQLELLEKIQGPFERGVHVLDNLFTLDEEDFNNYGSGFAHHCDIVEVREESNVENLEGGDLNNNISNNNDQRRIMQTANATISTNGRTYCQRCCGEFLLLFFITIFPNISS